jgi:hypothetical protein
MGDAVNCSNGFVPSEMDTCFSWVSAFTGKLKLRLLKYLVISKSTSTGDVHHSRTHKPGIIVNLAGGNNTWLTDKGFPVKFIPAVAVIGNSRPGSRFAFK